MCVERYQKWPKLILPLQCNVCVCVRVTSEHCQSYGVMVSPNYQAHVIIHTL